MKPKDKLPKFCTINRDRHLVPRVRFRRRGVDTYIKAEPGSEEFLRQYAKLLDRPVDFTADRIKAGTFNALRSAYYQSVEWLNLKPTTQAHRRRIIDNFCNEPVDELRKYGDLSVKGLKREYVKKIVAKKSKTPESANNLVKVLRTMLNFAVDDGWIDINPCVGIKQYRNTGTGFHTWTETEIAKFEASFEVGTKARLALALFLYTAQRVSDICLMGWQHVDKDLIAVRQQKTGASLAIPIHPELKTVLAATQKTDFTFITTARGAPFSAAGLSDWFKEKCKLAGLPHCSAHGLRKAACRRLAEAGCSANVIAAISGHATLREVERYTRAADQERMARQGLNMIQTGSEGERILSNLPAELSNLNPLRRAK